MHGSWGFSLWGTPSPVDSVESRSSAQMPSKSEGARREADVAVSELERRAGAEVGRMRLKLQAAEDYQSVQAQQIEALKGAQLRAAQLHEENEKLRVRVGHLQGGVDDFLQAEKSRTADEAHCYESTLAELREARAELESAQATCRRVAALEESNARLKRMSQVAMERQEKIDKLDKANTELRQQLKDLKRDMAMGRHRSPGLRSPSASTRPGPRPVSPASAPRAVPKAGDIVAAALGRAMEAQEGEARSPARRTSPLYLRTHAAVPSARSSLGKAAPKATRVAPPVFAKAAAASAEASPTRPSFDPHLFAAACEVPVHASASDSEAARGSTAALEALRTSIEKMCGELSTRKAEEEQAGHALPWLDGLPGRASPIASGVASPESPTSAPTSAPYGRALDGLSVASIEPWASPEAPGAAVSEASPKSYYRSTRGQPTSGRASLRTSLSP